MNTCEEVKALWKRCFNDSDAFTDLYFRTRFTEERNMAIREDGKIISALQRIPYPMHFCGEVIPVSYISGACTHPDYRAHGAMRRLLTETHRRMAQDGVMLSTLIPAEEWLFGYYARSGYAPAFGYAVSRTSVEQLHAAGNCRVEVCASPTDEHYHYFHTRMYGRGSGILHTNEDFLIILADLRLGEGKLLVARAEETIVGMAFVVMEGGTLYAKELLADNEPVKDALLCRAASLYGVQAVECLVPSSANSLYLGMARVIRAEALLALFARKYPASELYIRIEGDEAIPENNGCYTVKEGICSRRQVDGKRYRSYTLNAFTRLLLEAEHPYMSLMLN